MATLEKIPLLVETSDQKVSVELGGNPYVLRVVWNDRFGYFSLSLLEADETPILSGIKMVRDYPLIQRFHKELLPFGDLYFVREKGSADRAGYSDLGVNYGLYYYEPDTVVTPEQVRQEVAAAVLGTVWDSGLTTWDAGLGETLWDQ